MSGCADTTPPSAVPPEPADLIITDARIVTVDATLPEAEAMAIRGHRIVAVGSEQEVAVYQSEDTQVLPVQGRLVIPGFIEGHGHFLGLGRAQQILDLSSAETFQDIVGQVAIAVDGLQPGEWIFGRGWHQDKWQSLPVPNIDGTPLNDRLNVVAPENPVYLGHASGHAAIANDAALQAAAIDHTTADPPGGKIVRTTAGKATGLLRENAQDLVAGAIQKDQARLTPEQRDINFREQIVLAGREAHRFGVTSFHDAGVDFATLDLFKKLEAERALPVRLYAMVRGERNDEMASLLPKYRMIYENNDFLTVRSIKRQIDGALGSHGAWLLEPYEDLDSTSGLVLEPEEEIERTAELALQHGFQVNTHAIGTRANRVTLDIYERAWRRSTVDTNNLRWRIEHAQHIHPDDVPRFGALGVIAAVQGVHCTSDGPWLASRLGQERTQATSYRWRDLLDTGATISNGTDVPVEPINPIASFIASVSRRMKNGEVFYPDQAMTRMEALRSYTLNNAFAAFEENEKGSISPGKLADVVVLSKDIMRLPIDELQDTQVDFTILGGEVVYAREI
ncbi:MAG: amidohydrolase family protein [Pseudomonadales bacterium]|nr:amidohydrolase family protein [Pseudomonadales bacterium]